MLLLKLRTVWSDFFPDVFLFALLASIMTAIGWISVVSRRWVWLVIFPMLTMIFLLFAFLFLCSWFRWRCLWRIWWRRFWVWVHIRFMLFFIFHWKFRWSYEYLKIRWLCEYLKIRWSCQLNIFCWSCHLNNKSWSIWIIDWNRRIDWTIKIDSTIRNDSTLRIYSTPQIIFLLKNSHGFKLISENVVVVRFCLAQVVKLFVGIAYGVNPFPVIAYGVNLFLGIEVCRIADCLLDRHARSFIRHDKSVQKVSSAFKYVEAIKIFLTSYVTSFFASFCFLLAHSDLSSFVEHNSFSSAE